MEINNEFRVKASINDAWRVLTDLAGIAPCLPGAQLTGVDGDTFVGRVKVKVGPVTTEYAGTASFVEKDDANYRAKIDARGNESRGAGTASALISATLREDGAETIVSVSTDMTITGKVAQFGRGMIEEISARLLKQFADNIGTKILAGEASASEPAGLAGSTGPTSGAADTGSAGTAAIAPTAVAATEPEALDLLQIAGGSITKRVIPALAGLVFVVVIHPNCRRAASQSPAVAPIQGVAGGPAHTSHRRHTR